jgi:hypothetical protein
MKTCAVCGCEKDISDFTIERKRSDGLSRLCKPCQSQWRKDNREQIRKNNQRWIDTNPDKAAKLDASRRARLLAKYYENPEVARQKVQAWREVNKEKVIASKKAYRSNPDNRQKIRDAEKKWCSENKDKVRAQNAKWYATNSDAAKARTKAWRKQHPESKKLSEHKRRARIANSGGKLSKGLIEKLMKLQRGKCACCGFPLGDNYHIDHIMPLALGGSNTDDNIQLLRGSCNSSKRDKHPIDFMQQRGFLL